MKNRNLRTFLISLSMIVLGVFISLCIVLPTVNYNEESANIGNTFVNKNYESNDGKISATVQNGNQENNTTVDDGTVKFFTNEQTVSKTKNIDWRNFIGCGKRKTETNGDKTEIFVGKKKDSKEVERKIIVLKKRSL